MSGRGRGRGRAPPSGARLLLQRSAKEAGLDDGNLRGLQDITKPFLFPDYEWHSNGRIGHNLPGEDIPSNSVLSSSSAGGGGGGGGSGSDAANFANAEEEKIPQPLIPVVKPKRSASAIYLINKSREMHHRFQNSAFYVHPTQEADVIRHGKERQRQQRRPDLLVLKQMGKTADSRYIPPELLRDDDLENLYGHDDGNLKKRSLDDLAAEERADRRKRGTTGENNGGVEEDGNLSDATQDAIEEEEEEDADYGTNHYDSDGEDEDTGGGGDGDGDGDEAVF
jgi:hypothetical protein